MPTPLPVRTTRYVTHSPWLALLILAGCALAVFTLPAYAGINCFSTGTHGISLETGKQYVTLGATQATTALASVFRPDGQWVSTADGVFLLWSDYAKTAIFDGVAYHWTRDFVPLAGNPLFLVMCGESGTPLRPGQPGYGR